MTASFWNSLGLLSLLALAMPGFAPAGIAQTRPVLAIGMTNGLPRLTVTGATGKLYLVECADSLAGSGWRVLTFNLATNSPWTWVDTTAAGTNARQYPVPTAGQPGLDSTRHLHHGQPRQRGGTGH